MARDNANPTVLVTPAQASPAASDRKLLSHKIKQLSHASAPTYPAVPGPESEEPQPFTQQEIFDMIRNINDPEHPFSLEQLAVVSLASVELVNPYSLVVRFTPTIPHCSMATLIGLCIRTQLQRSLPPHFKIDVEIMKGTHQSFRQINKQLNDKERVTAALENPKLREMVDTCLYGHGN